MNETSENQAVRSTNNQFNYIRKIRLISNWLARNLLLLRNRIFYELKPLVPRNLQIYIRRAIVKRKRETCIGVWPIDQRAGRKPKDWSGWPNQHQFALVLMHDVDSARGQNRCRELMDLEQRKGFRSLFSFVPEGYQVSAILRQDLLRKGFEVGVHGLKHDGKLFTTEQSFAKQAERINRYLKEWGAVGFVSPSMHHNLNWMHKLNIEYDTSTFDTDPFEPQPDGVGTIFPFAVPGKNGHTSYIELPYTLPQDFTLFVLMQEKSIDIWKNKLDWIAERGGMALLITHPDYMNGNGRSTMEDYLMALYEELLDYIKDKYQGRYWHPLPREMAHFWRGNTAAKRADG